MKFALAITINLPRERVLEIFDDHDNVTKWQPNLVSRELLEGKLGYPGCRTRMVFNTLGQRIEMLETVISRDLPDEFRAEYSSNGVLNTARNIFIAQTPETTRWISENVFTFSGLKGVALKRVPEALYKSQTRSVMMEFKRYAEGLK